MISNLLKTLQKKSTSSFATLYTWGSSTSSLGLSTNAQSVNTPQKVSGLPPNIKNVVLGVNHSAVLTGKFFHFFSSFLLVLLSLFFFIELLLFPIYILSFFFLLLFYYFFVLPNLPPYYMYFSFINLIN